MTHLSAVMYILPYVLDKQKASQSEFCIKTLWLFLSQRGKSLWETDETTPLTREFVQDEYLTPNGFLGSIREFNETFCLFEVDQTRTNIKDFYMWLEKTASEEDTVWRPFFQITGNESYAWEEQAKQHILGTSGTVGTSCTSTGVPVTVQDIWDMVLRLPTEVC